MVLRTLLSIAICSLIVSVSAFTPQRITFSQIRGSMSSSTKKASVTTFLSAAVRTESSITTMSTVIEKPGVRTGGPAVLDRPAVEKTRDKAPAKESKRTGSEAWEVRIFNDGMNTREFVARCLVQITALSEITAYQTMMQAHQNGVAVVGRYVYEIAEMYHNELKKNGIVCDLVPVDEDK